ncbi:MAG: PrgI family protein [bacterium]|nr:PrgI family protein [bacterium]
MKFQVPQFIEVEDKIFGPLTIKQFVYLAGGGGLSIVIYLFSPSFFIGALLIAPVIGFSLALAFLKVNNRNFIVVLENAFMYVINPKLYIWKNEPKAPVSAKENVSESAPAFIPKLSNSKLKDLTWSLDTKETLAPITRTNNKQE